VLESRWPDGAGYRVSSYSGTGNCVAVARLASGNVAVQHSRNDVDAIVFSPGEWRAFLDGVKAGEFDI